MNLSEFLLSYFESEQYVPLRLRELADQFGLQGEARLELYDLVDQMLMDEKIKMSKRGRIKAYRSRAKKNESGDSKKEQKLQLEMMMKASEPTIEKAHSERESTKQATSEYTPSGDASAEIFRGRLQGNPKGFAFFVADEPEREDLFIRSEDLHGALHGDRVEVRVTERSEPGSERNDTGEVVRILQRNPEPIVGIFDGDAYGYVIPDRKQYACDIFIDEKDVHGAKNGDKVLVHLISDEQLDEHPEGRIDMVFGPADAQGVDISAVAAQFGIPCVFSQETLDEAEQLPEEVDPADYIGRKDLRKKWTVTIDGADAKDFDDAISVEKHGRYYNLYVHIADVSHYVKEGSAMDRDAYERGNSVYLLDRVIPMLPEKLSNGLCSLNPDVDRLTMTTQMTLDEQGHVVDHQFYPSVIHSNARLVYEDVSDYLEKGIPFSEDAGLLEQLDLMQEIYALLAMQRKSRGTLDFEFPETEIRLNEKGGADYVGLKERRVANRIIEEFMILNNMIVGTTFAEKKLPFIYRVHGGPSAAGLERINHALSVFHYQPVGDDPDPAQLRAILEQAKGEKEEGILSLFILQSMEKAVYSPQPQGHYGLALSYYSHFTSPIRRYSDLIAHRLLKAWLSGVPRTDDLTKKQLQTQAEHVSETEQKAEDAEHDVIDMKSAEYMQSYLGETFDGVITALTHFGAFIMLENTVEGLAHFRDMTDDYYSYDPDQLVARGEHSHRELHYGDRVRVKVVAANPVQREIDFRLEGFSDAGKEDFDGAERNERR